MQPGEKGETCKRERGDKKLKTRGPQVMPPHCDVERFSFSRAELTS